MIAMVRHNVFINPENQNISKMNPKCTNTVCVGGANSTMSWKRSSGGMEHPPSPPGDYLEFSNIFYIIEHTTY